MPIPGYKPKKSGSLPTETGAYHASMKAAAHTLKVDIAVLKEARGTGCDAFIGSGAVHKARLLEWLKKRGGESSTAPMQTSLPATPADEETPFTEDYNPPDEAGGVGQTLKSLQAYERRLKLKLDSLEKRTDLHHITKGELVKAAQDAWIKVVNSLLKYDLAVDMAKRESGELLPMADAVKGVQALLAWHTVATSDALRNVIPECEGKNKYQIAALLDPALRSAIYRNFRVGVSIGKIPEWMSRTAGDFIKGEPVLSLEPPAKASTNLDDY